MASNVELSASGTLVDAATGQLPAAYSGIGYGVGAGGSVTQITSAATAVTLNKICGRITTVALTTAAAAEEAFVVNNDKVSANDVVVFSTTYAGGGKPIIGAATNVGTGVFTVNITNVSGSALDALMVINFVVIKNALT
jgi:hypothetical protein